MYHVSAQGVDERMINVHYYYYKADENTQRRSDENPPLFLRDCSSLSLFPSLRPLGGGGVFAKFD